VVGLDPLLGGPFQFGGDVQLLQMQTADTTGDRIINAVPGLMDKIIGLVKKNKKEKEEPAQEDGEV